MGWNLAGVSVFSNLTLTRLWAAIVRNPRFERFLVGRGSTAAGVRVFRNLTLTRLWAAIVRNPRFERFFAWQRLDCCWRSGVSEPKLCFFLWVPKVMWSILSACFFAWHGLESCWCFGLFESDADETLSSHCSESTFRMVFCLAEARLLLAFGCFGTETLFFLMGSKGDVKHSVCVFFAWHGLESCWCFGLFESYADETLSSHRSESTFRTDFCLAEARLLLAFGCFGTEALFFLMGSKGDVKHSVCVFFAWHGLESCWRFGLFESDADETLSSHRSEFFIASEGDVKQSVCVFFAWHGLESCWCFGLFASDVDETLSSHRSESTFRTGFCLAEARLLLAFGCFATEACFFLMASKGDVKHSVCVFFCFAWARILLVFWSFRIWRCWDFKQPLFGIHVSNGFLLGRGSIAAGVRVFQNRRFVFYRFQRWREAFCLRVFCLAWAGILLVFLLVAVFGRVTSRSSALREMFSHWVAGATIWASRGQWSKTPPCHISGMRAWTYVSPGCLSLETAYHSARTRAPLRFLSSYGLSRSKTGIHMHASLPCFSSVFLCFVHPAELRLGSTWGHWLFELVSDAVPHS